MVQFWQLSFKIGSNLLRRPGFIGHMTFQEIQQFLKAGVDKFPVSITPLAVLLVKGAIRNAISLGGDSDTLAAITGSIAEAAYGIPDWIEEKALSYLDAPLLDVVHRWKQYLGATR